MSDNAKHRVRQLSGLPSYLEAHGVPAETVLGCAGLELSDFEDPVATVTRAQFATVLAEAARQLGTPGIGLEYGSWMGPGQLGLSARAVPFGPTLADGLTAAARLVPRFHGEARSTLERNGHAAAFTFDLFGSDPQFVSQLYECWMVVTHRVIAAFLGPAWRPLLIEFRHRPVHAQAVYEETFGAPVRFGAPRCALSFPVEGLESHARSGTEGPEAGFGREYASLSIQKERWLDGNRLIEHVERIIDGSLGQKTLSCAATAKALGLPQRTLQYRLESLGLTYQELVDRRRRRAAEEYLGNQNRSVTDVAFLLGYDDTSHFTRAFKRWSGLCPRDFKRLAGRTAAGP
ncbi:AraC family transcriptional regulator [Prosthecomicrobium sp. N25]|uniref:AraC family transcriptional regulator n=1 Tax=Prosthecomicrobium sp. N25 TaxID=3129254 RepID=UPI003076A4CC